MEEYKVLEGCPLDEGMALYFERNLIDDLSAYPGGIVIPVDKPYRWTSADVVRRYKFQLQRFFHQRKMKVGHAGTLDPLATGVLIVCAGKATKITEELQSHDKEYVATVEFGATTPSYDLEQEIDSYYPHNHITEEMVRVALHQFEGWQEQVPPIFSAKVIGGLRAYEYARAGESVELKKSEIHIESIELLSFDRGSEEALTTEKKSASDVVHNVHNYHTASDHSDGTRPSATIRVRCSKGTYIRSLARDLGLALGSGGYLTSLRRTASGPFHLK